MLEAVDLLEGFSERRLRSCHRGRFSIVPSRWVLDLAVKVSAVKVDPGSRHPGGFSVMSSRQVLGRTGKADTGWQYDACVGPSLLTAVVVCALGPAFRGGAHAIKMARTAGRGAEGRERELGDGRRRRETGLVLY